MSTALASVVTNTYTTGYSNSLKPSVDDKIGLFSPDDTPFMANMSKGKAVQRYEEWLEDDLATAASNAQIEGFDVTTTESTAPSRTGNYCQIFEKDFAVSSTMETVQKFGRTSELGRLRMLKTKELARDMEWAMLNGVQNAGTGSTARQMKGAFGWVDTTNGATDGRYYSFSATPAATNHITENILIGVLQGIWDQGVEADTVLCPMRQKRKISAFTAAGRLTINQNASDKKVTMSVRIIETDMGTVTVMAERFIDPTNVSGTYYDKLLAYKRDIFSRLTLRPVKEETLAKSGDSEKRMLVAEMTLKCATQKGVGSIINLTRVMP